MNDQTSSRSRIPVAIVADADPNDPSTNSGVALGLLSALMRRSDVEVLTAVGSNPRNLWKFVLYAANFRLRKHDWKQAVHRSRITILLRSAIRAKRLGVLPANTVVINVRNVYMPMKQPYVVFIDTTQKLSSAGWTEWENRATKSIIRAESLSFKSALHVFTAGQYVRDSVVNDYSISADKVTAVGGGVNFHPLPPVIDRNANTHDGISFLFVGRDFDRKGGRLLIEAFSMLRNDFPEAKLDIVGCTPEVNSDNVTVHGKVSDRKAMAKLYERADVFVHPALFEPYGLVVQEAMVFGLPSIVSDVGALSEIITTGQDGLVVPAGQVSPLADAMRRLTEDKALRVQQGQNARLRAEGHLTWDSVVSRMLPALGAKT